MKDKDKTKEQLINELEEIRQRISNLAAVETEHKQAEEALQQERHFTRSIVDTARAIILVLDKEGRILEFNPYMEQISGYRLDEVQGKDWFATFLPERDRERIRKLFAQATADMQTRGNVNPIVTKHGLERDIEWYDNTLKDASGNTIALVAIGQDITERRKAKEKLRESERKLKTLFEILPVGVSILDAERNIIYVNPSLERILDISTAGLFKGDYKSRAYLKPDGTPMLAEEFASARAIKEQRAVHNVETGVVKEDGNVIWTNVSAVPVAFLDWKVVIVTSDTTERKRVEEELGKREATLQKIFDLLPVGLWFADKDGKLLRGNPAGVKIWGAEPKVGPSEYGVFKARRLPSGEDIAPDDWALAHTVKEGMIVENELLEIDAFDGQKRIILNYTAPVLDDKGKIQGAIVMNQDITERKKAEEALKSSEENFRNSLDLSPLGIRIVTEEGELLYANRAILDMHGFDSIEELKATPAKKRYTPESYAEYLQRKEKRQRGERHPSQYEASIVCKDGEIRHLLVFRKEVLWNGTRQVQLMHEDITERKRAEEKTRESEEKFRSIVENSSDQIFMLDKDCKFLSINRTAADLSRKSPQEMIGMSILEVFPEDTAARFSKNIKTVFDTGKSMLIEEMMLVQGREFYNSTSLYPIKDNRGSVIAVTGIVRDITDRKRLEEERARAEKLESVGTLAGGIAHDFNNYLTAILGNIQLATMYAEAGKAGEVRGLLLEAEKASMRAKNLTQQLLTFSRGGAPVKKAISAAKVIEEAAGLALSGSRAKSVFSPPDDLWAVEADEGQIIQVVSNIVINADQAMPQGGTINISARNTVVGTGSALPLTEGRYVEISIEDHGIGIPQEHLGRIFDPYFTTKQKGRGLGLPTAYSIVKNHGGHITVESELGVGTTFHIYLPALKKRIPKGGKQASVQPSLLAQGKILVMDDQEDIREMLREMLGLIGYEVEVATDGAEAIEAYRRAMESSQSFDAVILDLTVPGGMGGKEAVKKLLEIDPGVKAIVSSGYANDPVMADLKKYGFKALVAKPYDLKEMQEVLRRVLAGRK